MISNLFVSSRYGRLSDALHDAMERDSLEFQLPRYLHTQRWFGGQSRKLQSVRIQRWLDFGFEPVAACLCVITAMDDSGLETDHQLVLAATESSGEQRLVVDALQIPDVRARLLEIISSTEELQGYRINFVPEVFEHLRTSGETDSSLIGAEQSNSSIAYDEDCILKLYRRLEIGENPEMEMTRYLSTQSDFGAIPRLLASARVESADGFAADAVMLQQFVRNYGDGWQWALTRAGDAFSAASSSNSLTQWLDDEGETINGASVLGQITAQLHTALAQAQDEHLMPAPATADDIRTWLSETRSEAESSAALLRQVELENQQELLDTISRIRGIVLDVQGEVGLKTRVHGDYHLGQVLKTDTGFVILDFEGEPARSLLERRSLQSPLVDVAGMLRSWSYAAETAFTRHFQNEGGGLHPGLIDEWELAVRRAFLHAYWNSTQPNILPSNTSTRNALLAMFELRKALYEIRYELNYRPAWVRIPAAAIQRLTEALTT